MQRTRREVLGGSVSLIGAGVLAGCLGDDGGSGEEDDHDDDHDDHDDHDHDSHDDDHDDHDHDDHDHGEEQFDHLGVAEEGFRVIDRNHDDQAAYVHGDHWHGNIPEVPLGEHVSLGAGVELEDGTELEFGDEYELRVEVADGADESIISFDHHGDHVHLVGEEVGITEVVFLIWHDDHADYRSPAATVQVVDDHEHDDDHHHDDTVSQFDVIDRDTDEVTAYVDGDHWHGSLPHIHEGEHLSLGARAEDAHGDEIEIDGDHWELRVDHAHAHDVVSFEHHGDHVHIIGEHDGETEVVFQLHHDGHVEYETPPIGVEVGHDHDDDY